MPPLQLKKKKKAVSSPRVRRFLEELKDPRGELALGFIYVNCLPLFPGACTSQSSLVGHQ